MVIGMTRPTRGKVLFRGRDIHEDLAGFRARLGYVARGGAGLHASLRARVPGTCGALTAACPDGLIERKARRLLELLSLEKAQYSPMSEYSKGMKQRVLLAASLLHDPELLVFDEPLSGLDAVSARLFKDLLVLLAREGKAILYISHVLEVVERVCDRVIVLSRGRVVADASPSELTRMTDLPTLEEVFAQLVRQVDTGDVARELVAAMEVRG